MSGALMCGMETVQQIVAAVGERCRQTAHNAAATAEVSTWWHGAPLPGICEHLCAQLPLLCSSFRRGRLLSLSQMAQIPHLVASMQAYQRPGIVVSSLHACRTDSHACIEAPLPQDIKALQSPLGLLHRAHACCSTPWLRRSAAALALRVRRALLPSEPSSHHSSGRRRCSSSSMRGTGPPPARKASRGTSTDLLGVQPSFVFGGTLRKQQTCLALALIWACHQHASQS